MSFGMAQKRQNMAVYEYLRLRRRSRVMTRQGERFLPRNTRNTRTCGRGGRCPVVHFAYFAYFAVLLSRATSQTPFRTTRSRRTAAPRLRSRPVARSDFPSALDLICRRRSLTWGVRREELPGHTWQSGPPSLHENQDHLLARIRWAIPGVPERVPRSLAPRG